MPMESATHALVDRIDDRVLVQTLVELAQIPTEVRLGENTFMAPNDPKLVHYVQRELRPRIQSLGAYDIIDAPGNQLVVRLGDGSADPCFLVMVYTPTQHHNLMEDPFSGKIARATEWGYDEPCVFGQGISQNKAHHAVMLALLKLFGEHDIPLKGTFYLAVNNEGNSSHECFRQILSVLPRKPQSALLLVGNGLKVSLGNRGRVDINVEIRGKASHSSSPHLGASAIDGANALLNRLDRVPLEGSHPILGGRHVLAYQIVYEPVAPHTLPEVARVKIDRRLIPGDDPDLAVAEFAQAIGDIPPYEVKVEKGPVMLPALVEPGEPGVRALMQAHQRVCGSEPQTIYGMGTYDAGGPCAAGIPAVMYGAGGGVHPLGVDFVPISQVKTEARVVAHTAISLLG